jgi:hypothetical protein
MWRNHGNHHSSWVQMRISIQLSIPWAKVETSIIERYLRTCRNQALVNVPKCSDNDVPVMHRADFDFVYQIAHNEDERKDLNEIQPGWRNLITKWFCQSYSFILFSIPTLFALHVREILLSVRKKWQEQRPLTTDQRKVTILATVCER